MKAVWTGAEGFVDIGMECVFLIVEWRKYMRPSNPSRSPQKRPLVGTTRPNPVFRAIQVLDQSGPLRQIDSPL